MDEFSLIKRHFAPLTRGFPGSLKLTDDAAVLKIPAGKEMIVTTDTINQGVHFIGNEAPDLIAQKLLRVNLSDLAAMGAAPYCYFLNLTLPASTNESWIKAFAAGLKKDQKEFAVHLAGGDTTATAGLLSCSVTAMGLVNKGKALRRGGAKAGDDVYVSGSIGDAALGLLSLQKKLPRAAALEQRYLLPQPRIALGKALVGIAHACMDVSDGLVQDLGHICTASKLGATIERALIPLSPQAKTLLMQDAKRWEAIVSGGDDYELLFAASKAARGKIAALAKKVKLPITRIGEMQRGQGVMVLDEGKALTLARKGYRHF